MLKYVQCKTVNDTWGQYSPDLDKSSASVKIKVKVLDLSVVSKLISHVFLLGLLMDVCHKQDPALDRCKHITHTAQSASNITNDMVDSTNNNTT